uniref:Transposase Helix-turn-helix domain-containing protein n=1 Tax=Amphimedon queenslandica TaxID=400682 RepID=A0A1X7VJ73_AMPQE
MVREKQTNCTAYAYGEDDFNERDEKVRFFTALTDWDTLLKFFVFVKPQPTGHTSLTSFQQLMLTLMRLRLGSSGIELAYKFGIHSSTVLRIFSDIIEMLYIHLKCLIIWPERETLRQTLPMQFRDYFKVSNCLARKKNIKTNSAYYIGGSIYVGLRLIFQNGGQIYNFQTLITLSAYIVQPYKWLN